MDDVAPLDDSARLVEGHRAEPFLAPYVRKSSSIVIALPCLRVGWRNIAISLIDTEKGE
jgi:hypothetical protein